VPNRVQLSSTAAQRRRDPDPRAAAGAIPKHLNAVTATRRRRDVKSGDISSRFKRQKPDKRTETDATKDAAYSATAGVEAQTAVSVCSSHMLFTGSSRRRRYHSLHTHVPNRVQLSSTAAQRRRDPDPRAAAGAIPKHLNAVTATRRRRDVKSGDISSHFKRQKPDKRTETDATKDAANSATAGVEAQVASIREVEKSATVSVSNPTSF